MTNQHPITPPYELIEEWIEQFDGDHPFYIATQAAQWGADMELEACTKWIKDCGFHPSVPEDFFAARRPKPPSLKEQALAELAEWENVMDIAPDSPIRRALEQLDD